MRHLNYCALCIIILYLVASSKGICSGFGVTPVILLGHEYYGDFYDEVLKYETLGALIICYMAKFAFLDSEATAKCMYWSDH